MKHGSLLALGRDTKEFQELREYLLGKVFFLAWFVGVLSSFSFVIYLQQTVQ